jgi:hypothetical protein
VCYNKWGKRTGEMKTFLATCCLVVFAIVAPSVIAAVPSPGPTLPPYATQDEQIHGRIISFDGQYHLQVRDDHGYIDNVELHPGTIINPTGLKLEPGMVVSINGYTKGKYVEANEIDTPYMLYGGVPYFQGHPWWYYGPSVSLSFFFGGPTWWHREYFLHPIRVERGVVVYRNPPAIYHGGDWHGRNYIATPDHGGHYPVHVRR